MYGIYIYGHGCLHKYMQRYHPSSVYPSIHASIQDLSQHPYSSTCPSIYALFPFIYPCILVHMSIVRRNNPSGRNFITKEQNHTINKKTLTPQKKKKKCRSAEGKKYISRTTYRQERLKNKYTSYNTSNLYS